MSGSQDKGYQSYIEPLAAVLTSPQADFSQNGVAGQLLQQLLGPRKFGQDAGPGTNNPNGPYPLPPPKLLYGRQTDASDIPGYYTKGGGQYEKSPPTRHPRPDINPTSNVPSINPSTGLQQFNLLDGQTMSGSQGPQGGLPALQSQSSMPPPPPTPGQNGMPAMPQQAQLPMQNGHPGLPQGGLPALPSQSSMPGSPSSMGLNRPTVNPSTGMQQFDLADAQMAHRQPQQLPPQVVQMLMQHLMQQQGGPGMPPHPGGAAPGMAPGMGGMGGGMPPPGAAGGGMPPGGPPMGQPPGQQAMTPGQMAARGRFGDQVVAHLTPGEVEIPPQIQTPHLMHILQQAFAKFGVSPQQFTAGSPQSSHNPATGAPEYSLLAALLPILGGAAGSFIPGLGTGLGAAIGGGLGGIAGGAVDHAGAANMLASGLGGAAGGYLSGGGLGGAAQQGPTATGATLDSVAPYGGSSGMSALKTGLGAGLGSTVGGMLAPANQSSSSGLPAGFNNPLPALNPAFNQMLGNNQSSKASFAGYNPYAAATGSPYNIYSPGGNGT